MRIRGALTDFREPPGRHADLDVVMVARLFTAKQVESPARGHKPGHGDSGQAFRDLVRRPGPGPAGIERLDVAGRYLDTAAG
jgi:hypothetical protein